MSNIDYANLLKKYEKFIKSFSILDSIYTNLRCKITSQSHFDKKYPNCFNNFLLSNVELGQLIFTVHRLCNEYRNLPRDQKLTLTKPNYKFAKRYNSTIALFKKELCHDSDLSGITYIPIVYEDRIEIINVIHDMLTGDEIMYGEPKLQLSDNKYVKYEDNTYFSNCINHYVEECDWKDIYFKTKFGQYLPIARFDMHRNKFEQLVLKINFTDHETKLKHYIYSDDTQLQNLLGIYSSPVHTIRTKLKQLIRGEWNNKLFKFAFVDCNKCKQEHFIVKKEKHSCKSCNFEICGKGCGRCYHGNLKCDSESTEMTAYIMKLYINSHCPGCKQYLEKIAGCNHMTCICKTQYCNQCGKEYEKDNYGHYKITEHYKTNIFDGADSDDEEDMNRRRQLAQQQNVCVQFPVVQNATNIAMPDIRTVTRFVTY